MNQNLCQLEALADDRNYKYYLWRRAREEAIELWLKTMMLKLYEQNKDITEELARLFADMCLKEGRLPKIDYKLSPLGKVFARFFTEFFFR